MNKKGSILDIFIWMILSFILLIVFAGLLLMFNSTYDGLREVGTIGNINITNITDTVFKPAGDNMSSGLNVLAFIIIAGGAFSILIHNFLVRIHPVWFIAYILMTILSVLVSAVLSNRYMELVSLGIIDGNLSEFTMGNFIMQYLPYWAAVIGIFGAILLFIGMIRDREITGDIR